MRFLAILMIWLAGCQYRQIEPPPIKREFRAAWIATVHNLDWPSSTAITLEDQKKELLYIYDFLASNHYNAVILQVRTANDAIYPSDLVPYSPFFDIQDFDFLQFALSEARHRGLEFHAWFNPFRVMAQYLPSQVNIKKEWLLYYGNQVILNPGIPAVRQYVISAIAEVVSAYDIDAVHLDDYFYPYQQPGKILDDTLTYLTFNPGQNSIGFWRRKNINQFVQELSDTISALKPHVKFGISPFGVWRNQQQDKEGSATKAEQTSYDNLFADTRLWMKNGWIDYIIPQVYWNIGFEPADYETLVHWWNQQSFRGHLYIGHAAYKVDVDGTPAVWQDGQEITRQIEFNRQFEGLRGSAMFSIKALLKNPQGLTDNLLNQSFPFPALVPEMPWKDSIPPQTPGNFSVRATKAGIMLNWDQVAGNSGIRSYLIYRSEEEQYPVGDMRNLLTRLEAPRNFYLDRSVQKNKRYYYYLTALDRMSNESAPVKSGLIELND